MWDIVISVTFLAFSYGIAYAVGGDADAFNGWMNAITHAAVLPAVRKESRLRVQLVITTAVSLVYHALKALDPDSSFYHPLEQLDVGMAVALVAHVLLIYMDELEWAPITFIAVLAACFPEFNVAITGGIVLVGYPFTSVLSFHYDEHTKWILFGLQVVSVAAFLLADTFTTYSLHPIWHVASMLSISYMIDIRKTPAPRAPVKSLPMPLRVS